MRGIDCAAPVSAKAAKILAEEGFSFVGRYLVPPESYSKALTRAEAEHISAAGLNILCVWETTAGRMKAGAAAGREDGARAYSLARMLDIPLDATLYFAADFDAVQEDLRAIREYMSSAAIEIQPYHAGVYGSYRVIEALKGTAIQGFWQCVAWSGGKISDAMTVYQAQWQGAAECSTLAAKVGFSVDIDECPDMDRAGMWSYRQKPAAKTEEETDVKEKVKEKRYARLDQIPKWGLPTVSKLQEKGYLKGTEGPADLDLSHDMLRILVINDRAGVYDK